MTRVGEQLVGRRRLDDAAEVHDGDAVGDVPHDRHVVGDQQHGQAELVAQVFEQVEHGRLHGDVERRDRLVGHEQLGLERERPRDRHALALAARELARVRVERASAEPDQVEQLPAALVDRAPSAPSACARSSSASVCFTVMRGLSDEYGSWKTIWIAPPLGAARASAPSTSPS